MKKQTENKVKNIENQETIQVVISSLILHKGFVAILPSNMFAVEELNVIFAPAAEEMVSELEYIQPIYSDEDLALLPEMNCDLLEDNPETSNEVDLGTVEDENEPDRGVTRKRKRLVSSDDDASVEKCVGDEQCSLVEDEDESVGRTLQMVHDDKGDDINTLADPADA